MQASDVLWVVFFAVHVAGQSSTAAKCTGTTTISSAADASAFAGCSEFDGTVVVATGVPDNVELASIGNIHERLLVKNVPDLKSLSLPVIAYIKDLVLDDLPKFEKLELPTPYGTAILNQKWSNLPSLAAFPGYFATNTATDIVFQETAVTSLQLDSLFGVFGGSLRITGNPYLQEISSNSTQIEQNLTIEDNGNLKTINGFSKLGSVGDFIEVRGNFTDFKLPSLWHAGNVILESSGNIDKTCADLQASRDGSGVRPAIKGSLTCNGKQLVLSAGKPSKATTASKARPTSSDSTSSDSSGGLSLGARIDVGVGIGVAALFTILLISVYLVRKRRVRREILPEVFIEKDHGDAVGFDGDKPSLSKPSGLVSSTEVERHELEQPVAQLPELSAEHLQLELGRNTSSRIPGIESRHEM